MKVYVITSGEYSDYCILTVVLSREKAEQICAMLNSQKRYYSDAAIIEEYDTDEVIAFVPSEDMPVFPENIQKWLSKHVKYPQIALENGVQGKVFVQFVVEKDGSVSNIKVVRGVDASLDKEAVRVVSVMPKWKPGKQRGKAVRVAYTLPIAFQIGSY